MIINQTIGGGSKNFKIWNVTFASPVLAREANKIITGDAVIRVHGSEPTAAISIIQTDSSLGTTNYTFWSGMGTNITSSPKHYGYIEGTLKRPATLQDFVERSRAPMTDTVAKGACVLVNSNGDLAVDTTNASSSEIYLRGSYRIVMTW